MHNRYRHIRIYFALAIIAALSGGTCFVPISKANDLQEAQRLSKQGLFRAAERTCLDALKKQDLKETDSALLVIELMRTHAVYGASSLVNDRAEIWERSELARKYFQQKFPTSQFGILVDLQAAMLANTRSELARFDAQIETVDQLTIARQLARDAIRDLEKIEESVGERIRRRDSATPAFSTKELIRIRQKTEFELGQAYLNFALTFEPKSPDQVNALTKCLKRFEALARLRNDPELAVRSRLAEARCQRLLFNFKRAQQMLTELESDDRAGDRQVDVAIEKTRLAISQGDPQSAIRAAESAPDQKSKDAKTLAELNLAKLEAYVLAARKFPDAPNVGLYQRKARQTFDLIDRQFAGYWKRRAETLFFSADASNSSVTNADRERVADSLFRKGEIADAIQAYDEAAEEAKADRDRWFELKFKIGVILHQQRQYKLAMQRLQHAAVEVPQAKRAAESHYLAIIDAAQIAKSKVPSDVEQYANLLDAHSKNWPRHATTNQVRFWLGQLRQRQREWVLAIAAYREIAATDEFFTRAIPAIQECSWALIDSQPAHERSRVISEVIAVLESIASSATSLNDPEVERIAMLKMIETRTLYQPRSSFDDQRKLLDLLHAAEREKDPDAILETQRILFLSYCLNNNFKLAGELLPEIKTLAPKQLAELLIQISRFRRDLDRSKSDFAKLVLEIDRTLHSDSDQLSSDQQFELTIILALAYSDSGELAEATRILSGLVQNHPHDGDLLEQFAKVKQLGDATSKGAAIDAWRRVIRGSKPGSDRWFRAKYAIAENLLALGQSGKSADLIRLTETLHPDMGGQEMKTRFDALLRRSLPSD